MKRIFIRLLIVAAALIVVSAAVVYVGLTRSLPQLDGEITVSHLRAEVSIERDASGIPVITANNRFDLAYATGYAHGQDRFFQMDLTRRKAAGELAEVFGEIALGIDKQSRLHRFRSRAERVLANLEPAEELILQAYSNGVNDGLSGLDGKPFEYFLLRTEPRPWEQADSLLVVYAMFLDLNDSTAHRDVRRGLAHSALPEAAFNWLFPTGTEWDAPITGSAREAIQLPGPEEFMLRGTNTASASQDWLEQPVPGSNNWAVAGHLTKSGAAIVANDMHLGISAPSIFYRARLRVTGDTAIDLNGVTLPGTPILVAGSNGRVAWTNTNSYGDWTDAVVVKPGDAPGTYLTPDGQKQIVTHQETILVKDQPPEILQVRETIWGPLLESNAAPGQLIAVSWIAHHIDAVNLGHLDLETVSNVEAAMDVGNRIGMPPQNFVVGDAEGNIGWTIAGRIPRRVGASSVLPADWSEREGWDGWVPAEQYPRILNPESGRIWTANGRVVDGEALNIIGDGGYDLGARATQIRDSLFAIDEFTPENMLAIQLDDAALFLNRWRELLLATLSSSAIEGDEGRTAYRQLALDWIPRAAPESTGYRLVRAFRNEVRQRAIAMTMRPVLDKYGEDTRLRISNQFEGPLWSLVSQKPVHLLTDDYADWDDLLLQAIDANIEYYAQNYTDGLEMRTWGELNTAAIRHPLSRAIPFLSRWMDMPADQLHGDSNVPRAQSSSFGASERFAVSPGDEANGYLHIPAGQSGHPLSDYYRLGHDDWVQGRATPFLPGEALNTLTLRPAATQ